MIDPISAVAMATGAFNTIKAGFAAGREIESMAGDLSRWMGAVSDIKKAEEYNRKPPLFKKLFQSGSVEEEALQLLLHEKKIIEQEKELQTILNFRYGFGTWDELTEMRRSIRAKREKEVYKQAELRKDLLETITLTIVVAIGIVFVSAIIYFIGSAQGKW